ncbi:hypothetical protein [Fulvivirga ligni]|uniref:hypothetical protein n=1 Tax=Fulvivirga ligni TaxID=2904246 RepID=UPI001F195459|nr:hypothetical protein [Fulvivirga ligni]UII19175.1 hypothetical protein LVD16_15120 [Fulvivirga ligni]
MELEEMKALWGQMSLELENQKKLTNQMILDMTKEKYKNRFRTINKYETIASVITFSIAIYVVANFQQLDNWYLATSGLITIAYLTILPTMVLLSLRDIRSVEIGKSNYKDTIFNFTKARKRVLGIQKAGVYMNWFFMMPIILVSSKLLSNKDLMEISLKVWWCIPIFLVALIIFSKWGYNHYVKITSSAENILKELEG